MEIINTTGERIKYDPEVLKKRLVACSKGLCVDIEMVQKQTESGLFNGVTTKDLEKLLQETAAYMTTLHSDYSKLAGILVATDLQDKTSSSFLKVVKDLYEHVRPVTWQSAPLVSKTTYEIVKANEQLLEEQIDYTRDLKFSYFGYMTLKRGYLLAINNKIQERPQHMWMRVAIGIHGEDMEAVIETYHMLSLGNFIHASPTLFHAGTPRPQLSSCFLVQMEDDSIEGIYSTLTTCALISKYAGGIGMSCHNIRAANSYISGTNGESNGLVPMLRVFNDTARYIDQGGNKRKGSFAIYLEPWHSDIYEFLDLKKNTGKEEKRARDLFYALWIPDLFMKRVQENGSWALFCPNEAKGLSEVWGDEFEQLYVKYEKEGKARKIIKAQSLWFAILESQTETGTPYMMYKDACNRKSNHQHLGTIKSSNLCTEIVQFTSKDEVAVCNLASIALSVFVEDGKFNHQKLFDTVQVVTKNLNKVIDINFYPVKQAEKSNKKHRPIGIGVQGLQDTFFKLRYPFDSKEAIILNREIFETIYFAALSASKNLAQKLGPYETYEGSPVSKGILQQDMWGVTPSARWDWDELRSEIKKHGVRNSLLIAPMPTATTAQILGNTECFEPITSNIYVRRVLSGEFPIINSYLVDDLLGLNLWNSKMINTIILNNGSIQMIDEIPQTIKNLYKTVWEIKQKTLIDMAADRGAFIDQSQSFNCFISDPSIAKLSSMHFYGWSKGLKTGMYYLRTKPVVNAIQFTVDSPSVNPVVKPTITKKAKLNCIDEEGCIGCSS